MMKTDKQKGEEYLTGRLLMAMPSMSDSRFHKAVIFLCMHDEGGAMGLVVNNAIEGFDFDDLLEQHGIKGSGFLRTIPVMSGGPVETSRGFLLHSGDFSLPDTIKISEDFSVTGTIDALKQIGEGHGPQKTVFALGYAGWGAGQLEDELRQNAWLVTEACPDIVFAAEHGRKWERALKKLGVDPLMLSAEAGRA